MLNRTTTVIVSTYAVALDEKTFSLRLARNYVVLGITAIAGSEPLAGVIVQEEACRDADKRDVTFKVAQSQEKVVLEQDEGWVGMLELPGRPIFHVFGQKAGRSFGGACGL